MKGWTRSLICLLALWGMLAMPGKAAETSAECSHVWSESAGPDATCTAEGRKTSVCSLCEATRTETLSPTGHSFGNWICVDEVDHKRVCASCGAEEMGNHSEHTSQVMVAATCTAEGSRKILCLCGYVIGENVAVPRLDHSYGPWIGDSTEHTRSCGVCGCEDKGSHNWGEPKVTREATCKEEGERVYTCTVCAKTKLEAVSKKKDHTYDNVCDPDCNICGGKRDAGHSYATVWSFNFSGHWHECTACGSKKDEEKHFPGPAATEQKAQLCLTCGYELMPIKNHEHSYEVRWSTDESGHWYACTGCETAKDYGPHRFDNGCDPECNVCAYRVESVHKYENTWQNDTQAHWSVCMDCGEETEKEKHIPGPEATETDPQLCTVCGYVLSPVVEHTHVFGPDWEQDDWNHWQKCACGEESIPREHGWEEVQTRRGSGIRYVCRDCGMEKTEAADRSASGTLVLMTILLLLLASAVAGLILALHLPRKRK